MAWVIAVVVFTGVQLVMSYLGEKVGVPVWLDVGPYEVHYGRGVDVEYDTITTSYGWGAILLSILAAIATWFFVQSRQTTAGGRADFAGFLLGGLVLIVAGIPLWHAFSDSEGLTAFVGNLLQLGAYAAAIFAGVKLSNRIKAKSSS